MRGMPEGTITTGELHTAFHRAMGGATTQQIADALDTTPTRAGNACRMLEDERLIDSAEDRSSGELIWTTRRLDHAEEVFDKVFPGLTTVDKRKRMSYEEFSKAYPGIKDVPNQKSSPKQGGKVMPSNTKVEFVKSETKEGSKKFAQVAKMIDHLRKTKGPVMFAELCEHAGAKYPQDVEASMFALEVIGVVEKFTVKDDTAKRPRIAYAIAEGNDAARPTRSTSTSSKQRSATQSKAKTGAKAKEEATPQA